jgi:hypothetical protein
MAWDVAAGIFVREAGGFIDVDGGTTSFPVPQPGSILAGNEAFMGSASPVATAHAGHANSVPPRFCRFSLVANHVISPLGDASRSGLVFPTIARTGV